MLFQVEDKKGAVLEANRILRQGGKVLLIDWKESFGGIGPHEKDVLMQFDAKKIMSDGGFAYDSNIDAGSHHYGMIFSKP